MPSSTIRHEDIVSPEESALTNEFIEFLKTASARRYPAGPMKRFNQGRQTAFLQADFIVSEGLPDAHRVGLFATPRIYPAWIRFANASSDSDRERDIRGMSIQVSNVGIENLTSGATTQDFVLNSHPVMLAPSSRDFLELLRANEAGGLRRAVYFLTHLNSARIGAMARQHPTCHLDIPYWSTTPYRFGQSRAVKYLASPTSRLTSSKPVILTDTYLTDAMRGHLDQGEATFDFLVQFHVDDRRTPIDDASVEWRAEDAPYHRVATIRIPRQRFEDAERVARGEQTAFNPWHCLPEHGPLGEMNRARRAIYMAMAAFRRQPRT